MTDNSYSHKVHGNTYRLTIEQIRDVWNIISEQPGVSFPELAKKTRMSYGKTVAVVDFLKECGTVTQAKCKVRTLVAPIPLITIQMPK